MNPLTTLFMVKKIQADNKNHDLKDELKKAKDEIEALRVNNMALGLRGVELHETVAMLSEALRKISKQPFNGSWDAQAVFIQETLEKVKS